MYVSHSTAAANGWADPSPTGIQVLGTNEQVINSTIQFSSGNGIFLAGKNDTAENNTIRDVDYNATDDAGIYAWNSGHLIAYNTIFDAGRDGIHLSHSTSTQILNNLIFDVMLQTTDGGGIYTYGTDGTGSRIAYNETFDITTHGSGYGAAGIYLDNFDSNYLVDHNVSFNNDMGIKLNPPSTDERIYNNTFTQNGQDIGSSGSLNMSGTVFENNIFTDSLDLRVGRVAGPQHLQGHRPAVHQRLRRRPSRSRPAPPPIDNGVDLGQVTAGFSGKAPDLGAFEYNGTVPQIGSGGRARR